MSELYSYRCGVAAESDEKIYPEIDGQVIVITATRTRNELRISGLRARNEFLVQLETGCPKKEPQPEVPLSE